MRGIEYALSRLPVTRAFIAGAALLAGATAGKADSPGRAAGPLSTNDETAMAIPRIDVHASGGVALPQPLSPAEAARLRRIFSLQRGGRIPEALRETEVFTTDTPLGFGLLGHVLADRYLGRFVRPGADDLRRWLSAWSDLPDAVSIRALLINRLPRGAALPAALPQGVPWPVRVNDAPHIPEESQPREASLARNPALDRDVHAAARTGRAGAVERLLARTRGLSPAYAAQLRGEAGQILFTLNHDEEALEIARPGTHAAVAGLAAGLAAWRMERPGLAKTLFADAWHAELGTPAQRSAAAFWAARAHLRSGDAWAYLPWLRRAAEQPRTFYGLIARRSLGWGILSADGDARETLSEADTELVAGTPAGARAFALVQVGEWRRAEAELRLLWSADPDDVASSRAIMLVAEAAGLSDLAAQIADRLQTDDGRPRELTRFALPRLRPDGGFKIDPALLFAVARAESEFDTQMVSDVGARGIMQIMPETARFIAPGISWRALDDPALCLDMGQRYIAYLADVMHGDLVRLLVGYNAGPGTVQRLDGTIRDNDDPLLFLEAIPVDETRAYVPRVLTYAWLYAARLRQTAVGLDDLASGMWPRYRPLPAAAREVARLH